MGWDVATPLNATMRDRKALDLLTPLSHLSYATAPPRHVVHQTRVTVTPMHIPRLIEINTAVAASSATQGLKMSMVNIWVDAARAQVRHATRTGIAVLTVMSAAATTSAASTARVDRVAHPKKTVAVVLSAPSPILAILLVLVASPQVNRVPTLAMQNMIAAAAVETFSP